MSAPCPATARSPLSGLASAAFLLIPIACGHPGSAGTSLVEPPPAPTSDDAIPLSPLSGKLLGQPFTVKSARYYVDQRPRYQKVEIKLYDADVKDPCEDLVATKPTSVWLRRLGPERVATGKNAIDIKGGGPWEVHYQLHPEDRWVGSGEANALFVVTSIDPDMKIEGELSACFRDATGSCVSGHFTATYCRIWIDAPVRGTDAMERPLARPPVPPAASGGASGP